MTKRIETMPRRKFDYIAVDQAHFEADWTGRDGEERTVVLFASEIVQALHEMNLISHELIRVSYDHAGNYFVYYQVGDEIRREDLPIYAHRYAAKHADDLIEYIERSGVVEDFLMDRA